jgi:hypothetical protein
MGMSIRFQPQLSSFQNHPKNQNMAQYSGRSNGKELEGVHRGNKEVKKEETGAGLIWSK